MSMRAEELREKEDYVANFGSDLEEDDEPEDDEEEEEVGDDEDF